MSTPRPLLFDPPLDDIAFDTSPINRDLDALFDDERVSVESAIAKRQREFATGRSLARHLIRSLGYPDASIPRGEKRQPIWPHGLIGSISHTDDICAVAIAHPESRLDGIGVDVELRRGLSPRHLEMICTPSERARLERLPEERARDAAIATFSAKEALYKCQFPKTDMFLGFQDVEITLSTEEGLFAGKILKEEVRRIYPEIRGRFVKTDRHILSIAILGR